MILMACVDGRNGMAFNCRRQSRDRAVRADLLAEAGEARLWVSGATARQFPAEERVERVVLYRWDRAYPADLYWDLSLEGWTLARREEFPGSSHEIITKEVYIP